MSKLSHSIECICVLDVYPAKTLLAQWQEQARKLEDQHASTVQQWMCETKDLHCRIAELQKMNENWECAIKKRDLKIAEFQKMNDNQFAQLEQNDRSVKEFEAALKARDGDVARLSKVLDQQRAELANLEAALVKAEGQVRCLQGVVDTQTKIFQAAPTPGHDLSVRLERQRRTIDEYHAEVDKLVRQINEKVMFNGKLSDQLGEAKRALAAKTLDCNDATNKLAEKTQQYDNDITARNADVRWLSKEREELKEMLDKQAKVFLLRCDGLVDLTNKMERQIHDLIQQRDSLKRHNTSMGSTVSEVIDERNRLQRELEQTTQRNDNQSVYIREFQEEVRKLREQLETEKAAPRRDPFKSAQVEVRIYDAQQVDVIERTDLAVRVRRARHVFDSQPKVQRRSIDIDTVDSTGRFVATVTEYGSGGKPLFVFRDVPINGLTMTTGA